MKISKLSFRSVKIIKLICFIIIFIINSCKKDPLQEPLRLQKKVIINSDINNVKKWYQTIYVKDNLLNAKTLSVDKVSNLDLSRLITPDWQNAVSYTKNNREIIEIPVSDTTKISLGSIYNNTGYFDFSKS